LLLRGSLHASTKPEFPSVVPVRHVVSNIENSKGSPQESPP